MSIRDIKECWEYLPQIVETMHSGLMLISPDGHILMVNKSLEQITGYKKDELLVQSCTIMHCDVCEMVRRTSTSHWCTLFE